MCLRRAAVSTAPSIFGREGGNRNNRPSGNIHRNPKYRLEREYGPPSPVPTRKPVRLVPFAVTDERLFHQWMFKIIPNAVKQEAILGRKRQRIQETERDFEVDYGGCVKAEI